jgi:hypothetical protein
MSAMLNHWLIDIIGLIGFIGLIGLISLIGLVSFGFIGFCLIGSLLASVALLDCWLISLIVNLLSLSAHWAYNGTAAKSATARCKAHEVL